MIIFCEECGERYIIENEDIKDSAMVFTCRVCHEVIRVPAPGDHRKPCEQAKGKDEKT